MREIGAGPHDPVCMQFAYTSNRPTDIHTHLYAFVGFGHLSRSDHDPKFVFIGCPYLVWVYVCVLWVYLLGMNLSLPSPAPVVFA